MIISDAVLKAVSELDLRARRSVSTLLAGNYRTAFRGSGMQFKEFRHYEPGDDIRHMSWAVTARTGKATVKLYEEDRELDVICLIDISGSSLFGTGGKRKIDMYAELVALIGLAAVKSGDNAGMLLFNDAPRLFLPPKRTRENVLAGLTHLLSQKVKGKRSNLAGGLAFARQILRNRSLIVVLSDFLTPPFEDDLRILAKRHEVILLHGYDDAERGSRLHGVYEVCDPENAEFYLLDTNSKSAREALALHQHNLSTKLQQLADQSGADYLALSVEDDYLQRLVRYFKWRGPSHI